MLILGTHCNQEKAVCESIQVIFGISTLGALKLCALIGVNPRVKLKHIQSQRLEKLKRVCQDQIGTDLPRRAKQHVKELIEVKHYKGVRHMFGLPARGQRTRTNASTAKKLSVVKQKKTGTSSNRSKALRSKK